MDYTRELDIICAERGTISDDNNFWVDKYSGYIIKTIAFDTEEGFDEKGFKLYTRATVEEDYTIAIESQMQENVNLNVKSLNPSVVPSL